MKVLVIVHGLPIGGTEIMVSKLARYFRSQQVGVEVGCLEERGELGDRLSEEGFPVTVYGRRRGLDAGLPFRIARHVRRGHFDVVHAHQFTCYFYAVLARLLRRVPLVFTEHGRFYPDVASVKRQWGNRVLQHFVDRITAVSKGVRDSLVRVEKFSPARIRVVYNGIDVEELEPPPNVDRDELRRSLDVPPDASVVGTVGRLDPIKNHRLLLHALARLLEEKENTYLLIAGPGPERKTLEACADRLGITSHVRFLGARRDIPRVLGALDVFALSSVSEGTPMTILETMAARVPIVSTAVGGIPEILDTGRTALLVPPPPDSVNGNAAEWMLEAGFVETYAGAIRALLDDRELASRLAGAASIDVRERFSLRAIGDEYLQIYREVAGNDEAEMAREERSPDVERQV